MTIEVRFGLGLVGCRFIEKETVESLMRKGVRFVIGIDISVDGSLRALLGGKARVLLGGKADARGISDVYSAALASSWDYSE